MTLSTLLLAFVGHVTLFGAIQHTQSQLQEYQALRSSLALATTPLGQTDLNGVPVASGTPIAVMSIPRLGWSEVISEGTTPSILRAGPGHRRDSVFPGQAGTSIILGRAATYGGPFAGLSALVPGDTISVITGQGDNKFTVIGLRRAGDLLPTPTSPTGGRLELVTADGPPLAPTGILYVDAALSGTAHETPGRIFQPAALSPGEGAMQTDPNAILPFLFALQWLAIAIAGARWLQRRWGVWQTWIVAAPVILVLGATTADAAIGLLPNLL
ncbi:sortase domain-bontaining protein [Galbitalea soli]|uniref:Class E sortase n=1 Tax=Galbitalea soli TaxID=1268042 RepID=A0A7C9PMF8_9MICO|nr:class E sortase [Galbitalea soli]NYJ31524.1 hypothetical protein [Galbitalea soli]